MTKEQKDQIDKASEDVLYFIINDLGGLMWRINHDLSHGRIDDYPDRDGDFKEMRETQEYCVSLLTKFGVDPKSVNDRENGTYWKWFHFWDNWKNNLSDEQWNQVDEKMSKEEDYSEFLPKIKWND